MREPGVCDGGSTGMVRLIPLAALPLLAACLSHPPPAAAPYRVAAKAPENWTVVLDSQHVTWLQPGQQPLRQPVPKPIIGVAGEIYKAGRIEMNVVHSACSDGRTSLSYPDTVQVYVDGRLHNGCGGI